MRHSETGARDTLFVVRVKGDWPEGGHPFTITKTYWPLADGSRPKPMKEFIRLYKGGVNTVEVFIYKGSGPYPDLLT